MRILFWLCFICAHSLVEVYEMTQAPTFPRLLPRPPPSFDPSDGRAGVTTQ